MFFYDCLKQFHLYKNIHKLEAADKYKKTI